MIKTILFINILLTAYLINERSIERRDEESEQERIMLDMTRQERVKMQELLDRLREAHIYGDGKLPEEVLKEYLYRPCN